MRKNTEETRYRALHRTLTLVGDLLRGKSHDRRTAAKRIGKKEAAAARQLRAIETTLPGVISEERNGLKVLRFEPAAIPSTPRVTTAVAACFGASLASIFEGSTYATGMREALQHVLSSSHGRRRFKDIERKFGFVPRGGEVALQSKAMLLDDVVDAVLKQRIIHMKYERFSGQIENVVIAPLPIVVCDHQLYIVGREGKRTLHPYRFSRIEEVVTTDEEFDYPSVMEYNLEQVFGDSLGIFIGDDLPVQEVELRLGKKWKTFARSHRWHRSQDVTVEADGVRLKMRVRVCPELEAWILAFGDTAEVIKPPELRQKIAAAAVSAAAQYANSASQ